MLLSHGRPTRRSGSNTLGLPVRAMSPVNAPGTGSWTRVLMAHSLGSLYIDMSVDARRLCKLEHTTGETGVEVAKVDSRVNSTMARTLLWL